MTFSEGIFFWFRMFDVFVDTLCVLHVIKPLRIISLKFDWNIQMDQRKINHDTDVKRHWKRITPFLPCSAVGCVSPRINFFVPRGVTRKKPALFHVERRNLDGPPPQSGVLAGSWRRTNEDAGGCFALKGWMMTFVFVLERKKNWNWSCFAGEDEVHLRIIWKWCMYCIYAVYIYTYT